MINEAINYQDAHWARNRAPSKSDKFSPSLVDGSAERNRDQTPDCNKAGVRGSICWAMIIGVLWLATRPYYGIVHDALFYMFQAIHELNPARFSEDLYFRFGSQDEFTIFSILYAPLLSVIGVAKTGIFFAVVGQVLWICTLVYFVRGLIRQRSLALMSVAAVIALPNTYILLDYGEGFVTPRVFAEALTMAALGLLVRRRAGWAVAAFVVSIAIHPLMTLSGLAFSSIYLVSRRPRWWIAIAAAVALLAVLSMTNIQPFANLHAAYDSQWFDVINVRGSFWLVSNWPQVASLRVLSIITLTIIEIMYANSRDRRLLSLFLAVGVGGILATLLGGDVAHNVFIIEIQPWRSMWLLTLVANLYAIPTVVRLYRLGEAADLTRLGFLIALGLLLVSRMLPAVIVTVAPMMLVAALLGAWQVATGRPLPAPARRLVFVVIASVLGVGLVIGYGSALFLRAWREEFWRSLYSLGLVIAALGIAACLVTPSISRRRQIARLLPWVAAALVPLALIGWDSRTPWTKFVESSQPIPKSLADHIPQNASVYWEGGLEMLWLRLQRPSYFSCAQATEDIFFRDVALAYQRRAEGFWPLRTVDFRGHMICPPLDKTDKTTRTRADLRQVCDHEPSLDYLVLMRPVEDIEAKIWDSPVANRDVYVSHGKLIVDDVSRFYIYACADVRSRDAGSTGAGAPRS